MTISYLPIGQTIHRQCVFVRIEPNTSLYKNISPYYRKLFIQNIVQILVWVSNNDWHGSSYLYFIFIYQEISLIQMKTILHENFGDQSIYKTTMSLFFVIGKRRILTYSWVWFRLIEPVGIPAVAAGLLAAAATSPHSSSKSPSGVSGLPRCRP